MGLLKSLRRIHVFTVPEGSSDSVTTCNWASMASCSLPSWPYTGCPTSYKPGCKQLLSPMSPPSRGILTIKKPYSGRQCSSFHTPPMSLLQLWAQQPRQSAQTILYHILTPASLLLLMIERLHDPIHTLLPKLLGFCYIRSCRIAILNRLSGRRQQAQGQPKLKPAKSKIPGSTLSQGRGSCEGESYGDSVAASVNWGSFLWVSLKKELYFFLRIRALPLAVHDRGRGCTVRSGSDGVDFSKGLNCEVRVW